MRFSLQSRIVFCSLAIGALAVRVNPKDGSEQLTNGKDPD
jgi:hypothetical protein